MTRCAWLAAVALLSGCSILLMEKPPDQVGDAYPVCTDGASAPVADVAFAMASGLVGSAVWTNHQDQGDDIHDDERNVIIAAGALAILHGTSAVLGARWISRCSAAHNRWELQQVRYGRPSDARPSATPLDSPPPRRAARGGDGEPCYPNGTCNDGFTCDLAMKTCRASTPSPAPAPRPAPTTPPPPERGPSYPP